MTRLTLLLLACSDYSVHAPNITDGLDGERCGRVPVETYTAGPGECVKLEDRNGRTLFKLSTSESCGGPPCQIIREGQTGYALELVSLGEPAEWSVDRGPCDELAPCCGVYLGSYRCW